jgi:stage 0 sporulation regulatory protein
MMRTKTVYKQHVLLKQINLKKKDMYKKAKQLGYTHALVVASSQELDTLLNHYQGIFPYDEVG